MSYIFTGGLGLARLVAFLKGAGESEGMQAALKKVEEGNHISFRDTEENPADAERYGIEMVPALVVEGEKDFGIRFYGIPRGREERALKDAIKMVDEGDSGLPDDIRKKLASISTDVHIRVFTTPQCIYCPKAVKVAFGFAVESPRIMAESIDATEFDELAMRFRVRAVPTIVLNDAVVLTHQGSRRDYVKRLLAMIEHLEGQH
jgi:glutaredoxin-like protein